MRRGRKSVQHKLALALTERVQDRDVSAVEAALAKVRRALRASARLRQILIHRALRRSEKTEILSSLASLPEPAAELLLAMCESRSLDLLGGVMREFRSLRAARARETSVSIESAAAFAADEMESIRSALVTALGRPVRIVSRIRKVLLAGFRIRIGEKVIDGTVRGALERMEKELTSF